MSDRLENVKVIKMDPTTIKNVNEQLDRFFPKQSDIQERSFSIKRYWKLVLFMILLFVLLVNPLSCGILGCLPGNLLGMSSLIYQTLLFTIGVVLLFYYNL